MKPVHPPSASPAQEFWSGVRAELPILLGVAPFGMIYGALALQAGIPLPQAQAMSAIVFAGSSQFIATDLIGQASPNLVVILTIAVVNLRHALYSASVAPYIQKLSAWWKAVLAYLLTDEAYAVTIIHYTQAASPVNGHWFFLGAGLTLWLCWQASTAVGIALGAVIPPEWGLDFSLSLTFIALLAPALKDRAGLAASLTAGLVAVLAFSLPYKLWIIAAALAGVAVGLFVEGKK